MTEADWINEENPFRMLDYLRDGLNTALSTRGRRKLRLYACGCCRQIWHLLRDERSRAAVSASEAFADNLFSQQELSKAHAKAIHALQLIPEKAETRALCSAAVAALAVTNDVVWQASRDVTTWTAQTEMAPGETRGLPRQAQLVREEFGNPFQAAAVEPEWLSWNDGTVIKLAKAIYVDRRFDIMPILSDALEEAGCTAAEILAHCRQPSEHIRGCWVIDMLLGQG